jgi:hypothetical protein
MFSMTLPSVNIIRLGYLLAGWTAVALGIFGVIMPLVPGVPFFVLAAWCFSRGSMRVHDWLVGNRWVGPPIRNWRDHKVIPLHGKIGALLGLVSSVIVVGFLLPQHPAVAAEEWLMPVVDAGWPLPAIVGAINTVVGAYILSRPSRPPRITG